MTYIIWAYLIMACAFLPLYMKDGYYMLGEAKGTMYLITGAVFMVLCLLFMGKRFFGLKEKFKESRLHGVMGIFFLTNLVTYIFSFDKKVSFFGLAGWRTGFSAIILMVFFYYICAFYANRSKYLFSAMLVAPFLIFILAILGRVGIYPIEFIGQNNSFLSTIGNINWFTGFLSVFVPVGMGLCAEKELFSKEFWILSVYVFTGLMALLLQGSDAGALVVGATYLTLLVFTASERSSFKAFLVQLFILGLAMEASGFLWLIAKEAYTYEDNILTSICSAHIGLVLVAAALFLYRLVRLFEEIKGKWHGKAYTIGAFVLVAATVIAGIIYLAGSVDLEFGNSRGLIWSICLDLFKGLNPLQKLVGIGQDGIYSYAYRDPETTTSLMNVFGFNQLTNAHCEPLTILIERGILGLVSYLALVACAFITFWKNKKENTVLFCVLPIAAYFAFGLVSFSLPVSTPYLWLFLGLGQGYCRPVHGKTNES